METDLKPASATMSKRETSPPPAGPRPPAPVKARPVALSAQLTLEAAFQTILQDCLAQIKQLRRLTALQDGLDALNDLASADALLAQLAQESETSGPLAAYARGDLAALAAAKRESLRKVLRNT